MGNTTVIIQQENYRWTVDGVGIYTRNLDTGKTERGLYNLILNSGAVLSILQGGVFQNKLIGVPVRPTHMFAERAVIGGYTVEDSAHIYEYSSTDEIVREAIRPLHEVHLVVEYKDDI